MTTEARDGSSVEVYRRGNFRESFKRHPFRTILGDRPWLPLETDEKGNKVLRLSDDLVIKAYPFGMNRPPRSLIFRRQGIQITPSTER